MNWNKHLLLEGKHAFLSASKWHWKNYDEEKLLQAYNSFDAKRRGTEMHEWAAKTIKLRIRQSNATKPIGPYVNDAIGFKMDPEILLYYSDNCFGTADAISFRKERRFDKKVLRIHDLKTGAHPGSMHQLEVYAALFCLEYGISPIDIYIFLRIYQFDGFEEYEPLPKDLWDLMDKIISHDKLIENIKNGER